MDKFIVRYLLEDGSRTDPVNLMARRTDASSSTPYELIPVEFNLGRAIENIIDLEDAMAMGLSFSDEEIEAMKAWEKIHPSESSREWDDPQPVIRELECYFLEIPDRIFKLEFSIQHSERKYGLFFSHNRLFSLEEGSDGFDGQAVLRWRLIA